MLDRCQKIAGILLRLAFAAVAICICKVTLELPTALRNEAWETREQLAAVLRVRLDAFTQQTEPVLKESATTIKAAQKTLREVDETLRTARPLMGDLQTTAQRATQTLASADMTLIELGHLRADVKPVLASVDETLMQTSSTVAVLRPQLLGLTAAGKTMAGTSASAARQFEQSLPQFLLHANRIAENSDRTTRATAGLVENLRAATTPLPKWMRVGVGLGLPLVQIATAAVGIWAVLGR